jgi:uncharacterized membrane protein/1-acyl-sn-glycerol-3-phosphate acyltransferase
MSMLKNISVSTWAIVLIAAHVVALIFGLAGLLIAVPNPHLWADSELGVRAYTFGMQYAGGLHILFATAVMLLIGVRYLGLRRTVVFFVITCVVSLSAELIGTTSGFPFGDYSYTSGLGYKILGEVPFTIPLSWFYMGLASYLLAVVLVGTGRGWKRPTLAVFSGAMLLTIWDLVLDPAMAHPELGVRFWVWDQSGLYFGMPAQNFLGWVLTGVLFIGISRLVWGGDPAITPGLIRVSYVIYLANLIFAMVISGAVGLWWPVLITVAIGVIPATVALLMAEGRGSDSAHGSAIYDEDTVQRVSRGVMTTGARFFLARDAREVRVEGLENLPEHGPVLIIARHYHHLLDGCVLYTRPPRPVHLLVASDWAEPGWMQSLLETGCRMALWPLVVRPGASGTKRMSRTERTRALRAGFRDAIRLLQEDRVLVVFPEGYPDIDPHGSRKKTTGEMSELHSGFVSIVRAAERRTESAIPIVPIGFAYARESSGKWNIDMRIGTPRFLSDFADEKSLVEALSARIRALSVGEPARGTAEQHQLSESS